MRDGLSLLDQLLAFGGGKAGEAEARAMLGSVAREHVVRLAELLGGADSHALLRCAQALEEFAPDYAQVLDELAALLVRVGLRQAVSGYEGDELYEPQLLEQLAQRLTPEDVQLFYQTAILGRRDLALAPDPRSGFEMTLLRMLAFRPGARRAPRRRSRALRARRAAQPRRPPRAPPPASRRPRHPRAAPGPRSWVRSNSPARRGSSPATAYSSAARAPSCAWRSIRATSCCAPRRWKRSWRRRWRAITANPCGWSSRRSPRASRRRRRRSGAPRTRSWPAARRAFEDDAGVKGLRERFGATVLPETVRPVK